MNKSLYSKTAVLLIFILFFSFQNCGKVQISGLQKASSILGAPELTFSITSTSTSISGISDKVLFVIDMSGSNLGKLKSSTPSALQNPYYWWDATDIEAPATDLNGDRIKAVQAVIESCHTSTAAQQSNSNAEKIFKIMGFSNSALFGLASDNCQSEFYNAQTAKLALDGLLAIQESNKQLSHTALYNFTMMKTSYYNALDCSQQLALYDAYMGQNAEGVSGSKYKVFFVTDGQPDEGDGFSSFRCPENDTACTSACSTDGDSFGCKNYYLNKYKSQINLLNTRLQSEYSKTFEFNSLYYGKDSEFESAKSVLSQLTNQPVLKISNVVEMKNQICNQLKTESTVRYNIENVGVYNLNAIARADQLMSDSDTDGIPDSEDSNTKSSYLSEDRFVNSENTECRSLGLGLTSCDNSYLKSAKSYSKDLSGLDSDNDGIIDYIELIKGTHPLVKDDFNRDDDNDGTSNIAEILKGHDPLSNKILQQTIESDFAVNQATGEVQVKVKKFPLMNTREYKKSSHWKGLNFNHAENENVMLITYVAKPIGTTSTSKKKLFAAVVRVSSSSILTRPVFIEIGDF